MSATQTLSASQVGSSIFGMLSGMFAALSNTVITTAVKGTVLIDKSLNVAIHGVSAAENISEAVEKRSKSYGEGIIANGELAERERTLKYILRLKNLEKQEETQPETASDNVKGAREAIAPSEVKVSSAVPAG